MLRSYRNGEVPASWLTTFATGWLPVEGTWKHQLPPATYRKHLALVALAKRNTGRVLKISEGWGAYRPLNIQEYAKRIHGRWAATPGTSSHGMFWEGRQCAAIDYGNWGSVYNWDRDAFYRDVRAVGLVPGLISVARGYPDEPWHVVDLDPWAPVPASGGTTSNPISALVPAILKELDDMDKAILIHYVAGKEKAFALIGATVPGGFRTTSSQETANRWARLYGSSKNCKTKAEWQATINEAKALNEAWVAQQRRINA